MNGIAIEQQKKSRIWTKSDYVPVLAQSLQSCLTLCDSVDCSPQGSSVYGNLQARILEWIAIPLSRGIFPTQGLNPHSLMFPALAGGFFTSSDTWEAVDRTWQ